METPVQSIDKAFEWFLLLLTVLVAVIFQFLTWAISPKTGLQQVTKFMFSLIMPLSVSVVSWLSQLITLQKEKKLFLRLFSWSILSVVFLYYLELFFALVVMGWTSKEEYGLTATMVVLIVAFLMVLFPHKQILATYRAATINSSYWEKGNVRIWSPFFVGFLLSALLILLPFLY